MYECEEYGDYFEPSEADILFDDFKDRCRDILLADIKQEMSDISRSNESLRLSNSDLTNENRKLKSEINEISKKIEMENIIGLVLQNLNKENVSGFCDLFLKRDYPDCDSSSNTPIWIKLMTSYYSNKELILDILKLSGTKYPVDVFKFRLPISWNEEELDMFFATLGNHYVCNGNIFSENLGHWQYQSLKSVKDQCKDQYSQIPWQFVLRNPLLKEEKYLELIGKNMMNYHGEYFCKIKSYQDVCDEKIKIIIKNIDHSKVKSLRDGVGDFLLKNIDLIDNDDVLDKIYEHINDIWQPFDSVKQMKPKYIKRYLLDHKDKALELLDKCDNLGSEDKKEIIFAILGD